MVLGVRVSGFIVLNLRFVVLGSMVLGCWGFTILRFKL